MWLPKVSRVFVLVACLILAIVLTSITLPRFERASWLDQIVLTAAEPPLRIITWSGRKITKIWNHYISLTNAAKENEYLRKNVEKLNLSLMRFAEVEEENTRLKGILGMASELEADIIGARVIANDPYAEFKTITIDQGYKNGVSKNMVVVGRKGLIGKIGEVAYRTSKVLLINDLNNSADAMDIRSRVRALMVGRYNKVELEYLHRTSDVKDGDAIITSGLDGVYPKGIPIGVIKNTKIDPHGIFQEAEVEPLEDFNALEEVAVIVR